METHSPKAIFEADTLSAIFGTQAVLPCTF
jgi:hypothetical protein